MDDLTCPVCAEPVPEKAPTGPRPKYCSKACRSRADYARNRERRLAVGAARTQAVRATVERECKFCGVVFSPPRTLSQLYCTPRCASAASRDASQTGCSEPGCDRPMRAKGLCSMHWRRVARAEGREANPAWDDRRKANWMRRAALKRGAPNAEAFVYRDVFERDGWVCGICSGHVDRRLDWPHPMSASLDHILPLSKGGPHVAANAQCAHLACNVRKGALVTA